MTRNDFFDFMAQQAAFVFTSSAKRGRDEMDRALHRYYKASFDSNKMLDHLCAFDSFFLKRIEKKSGDTLFFYFGYVPSIYFKDPAPAGAFYWEDKNIVTVICVTIENCSGTIEHIYISEDGKFYNDDHKLIAATENELLDYIASVEYDFHPAISERTYYLLKKAGWYQDRKIDISKGLEELALRNIKLTAAQQDFLREFGGLYFRFEDNNYDIEIYSAEQLTEDDEVLFEDENIITVGIKMSDTFGLDTNGILYENGYPLGRTMLEGINHLLNKVPFHYKWK